MTPGRWPTPMAAADRRLRVVHHPTNRKLGGSLKTGFAEATGDLVLYSDADLPFDMDELVKACRVMRHYEADIVSAYRFDRTGRGLRARRVLGDLQLARPLALRRAAAGHQLRVQADAAGRCSTRSTLDSEGSFIDAELIDPGHAATATRSCSSASTTSRAREASPRSARRPSSSSCCGRCSRCEESCGPSSRRHAEGPDGRSPVPWRAAPFLVGWAAVVSPTP